MTNANDRWHPNVTIIIVLDWTKLHFDLDLSWQHFLHCRELIFEPYYFEIYLLFYLKVYNSKRWKCLIENVKIFLAKLIFFIKNELSKEKCPFSSSIFAIYFVFHFLLLVKTKEKQSKVIERDTISLDLDPRLIFDSRRSERNTFDFLSPSLDQVSRTISPRSCSALSIEPAPLIIIARNEGAVERGLFRPKQS